MKPRHLFLFVVVSLLGTVMISAGVRPSAPPKAEIKILNRNLDHPKLVLPSSEIPEQPEFLGISEYLTDYHEHEFKHEKEAVVVIKFPSCSGTVSRIFEYLDTAPKKNQVSVLALKEIAEPVYNSYRDFYESGKVSFRDQTEHLKRKTNISIDYPELYLFENGSETNHMTATCNNFEQVIESLEEFLDL